MIGAFVVDADAARRGGPARQHVRPGGSEDPRHDLVGHQGGRRPRPRRDRARVVPDAALPVLGLRPVRLRPVRQEPRAGWRGQGRHAVPRPVGRRGAGRWRARSRDRAEAEGPRTADPHAACSRCSCWVARRSLFGSLVSTLGFAALLFCGFFSFFLGKISSDTITQQSMPDDFRGRAFALYDIAYNIGFIVPAIILSMIWVEGSASQTRLILMVSGAGVPRADRPDRRVGAQPARRVRAAGRSGRRGCPRLGRARVTERLRPDELGLLALRVLALVAVVVGRAACPERRRAAFRRDRARAGTAVARQPGGVRVRRLDRDPRGRVRRRRPRSRAARARRVRLGSRRVARGGRRMGSRGGGALPVARGAAARVHLPAQRPGGGGPCGRRPRARRAGARARGRRLAGGRRPREDLADRGGARARDRAPRARAPHGRDRAGRRRRGLARCSAARMPCARSAPSGARPVGSSSRPSASSCGR